MANATSVYNPITVCKMSSMNSSKSVIPTMAVVSSVATGGAYIDCSHMETSKMILIFKKTATGTNAATVNNVRILDGDSKAGYSGFSKGNLVIDIASGAAPLAFAGPFETARFKDSMGNIEITCTRGENVAAIGAIGAILI